MFLKRLFRKNDESISRKEQKENQSEEILTQPPTDIQAKFLFVSDLHVSTHKEIECIQEKIDENNYDAVFLLGDIDSNDVKAISEHTDNLYYVLGNHDSWTQNTCGIHLDGKSVEINRLRIGGVSGANRYKEGDFAMRTNEEMEEKLKELGRVDILISHESPYHLMSSNSTHGGFQAISDYLFSAKPFLHVFGHHHEPYENRFGNTREVCVYRCAEIYVPYYVRWIRLDR